MSGGCAAQRRSGDGAGDLNGGRGGAEGVAQATAYTRLVADERNVVAASFSSSTGANLYD